MKTLTTRGLSAGSLYKLLYIGLAIPFFIIGLATGLAAFFGKDAVTYNDQYVYGVKGLIVGVVSGILSPILTAIGLWILMMIGIWLWTRFKPIDLTYKE